MQISCNSGPTFLFHAVGEANQIACIMPNQLRRTYWLYASFKLQVSTTWTENHSAHSSQNANYTGPFFLKFRNHQGKCSKELSNGQSETAFSVSSSASSQDLEIRLRFGCVWSCPNRRRWHKCRFPARKWFRWKHLVSNPTLCYWIWLQYLSFFLLLLKNVSDL